MPAAEAAIINQFEYDLWSHPDGALAPPPYGLRIDGIEWYATGGASGGNSDAWTFDFDHPLAEMRAVYTVNDGVNDDTFRIFGTAIGGRDISGTNYDGPPVLVDIDFTYTGFDGQNDFHDPEIHVNDGAGQASTKGMGTITFQQQTFGIQANTTVNLLAFANGSGNLFNFDVDPAPGHRLNGYCGGANPPAYCGMPVGWGWLALADANFNPHTAYHTSFQDFIFVSNKVPVPEPTSLAMFGTMLGTFSLASWIRRRKKSR
ncbi:PEP-CTERM sorting domain-containing protein [Pelagibius sp.]|uniref:PEP-CTERM sorting domain-containing protein n=1 Tax=Pelagibius sp. TaxID=1931238 RepID=UPI00260F07FE|nr:PEP-CTERM sorting domain-containing protein [Pelagibius sp.]